VDSRPAQFEALVRAHASGLYRYSAWLGNNKEDAEDLVQETFMRAWKALDSLRDARAARGWLMTILRREHARRFERPRAEDRRLDDLDPQRLESSTDADRVDVLTLRQGIAALSTDYREPLLLQVLGGYSCEEIGVMLGVKPGAVMTRLSRARQKLRKRLGSAGGFAWKAGGSR